MDIPIFNALDKNIKPPKQYTTCLCFGNIYTFKKLDIHIKNSII